MNSTSKIEYQKAYRHKHKAKLAAYFAARYSANRQRLSDANNLRYHQNKDRYLAHQKEYYEKNKAAILNRQKPYRDKNRTANIQRAKEYASKYPERVRAYKKKWQDAHKLQNVIRTKGRRAKLRGNTIDPRGVEKFYTAARSKKWVSCYWCQALVRGEDCHIDHIIPVCKGGKHAVENLCTSCCTCNQSKGGKMPARFNKLPQMFMSL